MLSRPRLLSVGMVSARSAQTTMTAGWCSNLSARLSASAGPRAASDIVTRAGVCSSLPVAPASAQGGGGRVLGRVGDDEEAHRLAVAALRTEPGRIDLSFVSRGSAP